MRIWVDADACPKVIEETLFRAADRAKIAETLLANSPLSPHPQPPRQPEASAKLSRKGGL